MKKIIVLVLCMIMISFVNLSSFATKSNLINNTMKSDSELHKLVSMDSMKNIPNDAITHTYSERDLIETYKKMSNLELENIGFSDTDINMLKKFDYDNTMQILSKLPESDLSGMGYNESEIEYINYYSVHTKSLASINITVSKDLFYYSTTKTTARIRVDWEWTHPPFWMFTDKLAVSVAQVMYYNSSRSYSKVDYYIQETGAFAYSLYTDFVPIGPSSVVSTSIDVLRGVLNGIEWAKKGTSYVQFEVSSKYVEMGVYAAYGHTLILFSPSITISSTGFISFSPSINVSQYSAYTLLK